MDKNSVKIEINDLDYWQEIEKNKKNGSQLNGQIEFKKI